MWQSSLEIRNPGFRNLFFYFSRLLKNAYLLRCAASFVTAAYAKYASFLRICAPCIEAFLNSLCDKVFFNTLLVSPSLVIASNKARLRPGLSMEGTGL